MARIRNRKGRLKNEGASVEEIKNITDKLRDHNENLSGVMGRQAELVLHTAEIDGFIADACRQASEQCLETLTMRENMSKKEYIRLTEEILEEAANLFQNFADSLDLSVKIQTGHGEALQVASSSVNTAYKPQVSAKIADNLAIT